jgi:LmbE family N-acetylglucosaminyl deacetylase
LLQLKKLPVLGSVLYIAAHPDDEVLGCGATIARLSNEGWKIHVLIVAEGATSRAEKRDVEATLGELSALAKCAEEANKVLGNGKHRVTQNAANQTVTITVLGKREAAGLDEALAALGNLQ